MKIHERIGPDVDGYELLASLHSKYWEVAWFNC